MRPFVVVFAAVLLLSGCSVSETGGSEDALTTSVPSTSTTAGAATTTEADSTTEAVSASSTTEPQQATASVHHSLQVSDVVEWVQAWLDAAFNSEIDHGLAAASLVSCADSGPVEAGDVFACELVPRPAPGFALEGAGLVIYVVDDSGRAAWHIGDVPDATAELVRVYDLAPKGLLCRGLLSPDLDAALFHRYPFPSGTYFWSLVYWSLEGRPDRMDADGNGIPCETLHDPTVVASVLEGGATGSREAPPLGLALRPDGLGPVDFGTDAEAAVDSLGYFLGLPDSDVTVHHSEVGAPPGGVCYFGYPCNENLRVLSWDALGLWVVMSDLAWPFGDSWPQPLAPMNLIGYAYVGGESDLVDTPEGVRTARLLTDEGIGIGSTVAELRSVYGGAVGFDWGCLDSGESWTVIGDAGQIGGALIGTELDPADASVEPVNPDATVASIEAGAVSSC